MKNDILNRKFCDYIVVCSGLRVEIELGKSGVFVVSQQILCDANAAL